MNDCIERRKAIELIQPHVKPQTVYGEGYLQAIEHATDILELIPAADVKPVKHAYWEEKQDMNGDTYYHCTNCKEDFVFVEGTPKDNLYYYCPNCGYKMDGGAENETD